MQQDNITGLSGLKVQQNSFTVPQGALERAVNCVLSQDNIIAKNRGMYEYLRLQTGQVTNCFFDYQSSAFFITQNVLYRHMPTRATAVAKSLTGSQTITIIKVAHGITNGDFISDFQVTDEAFISAFPGRYSDFWGIRQIQSVFTTTASRTANVVTVTLANHGLSTGSTINVTGSTLSPVIATGTKTITVTGVNTFTFADVAANSSGNITFTMLDAFKIQAVVNATATVTSTAASASYLYYTRVPGQTISVTPEASGGVDFSVAINPNESAYFTTDNGIIKLEREDLPTLKAGIPPGLDLQIFIGTTPAAQNPGPLIPNRQVGYRVLFSRTDASGTVVLGAPSQFVVIANTLFTPSALAYVNATNILTVTYNNHGLTGTPRIYFFNVVSAGAAVPDGTFLTATITGVNTFTVDFDDVGLGAITNITAAQFGLTKSPQLYFTIPSEILSTQYAYRVYRSTQSVDLLTLPPQDYRLVYEANITTTDIANEFVSFLDEVDDLLIGSNTPLYTNPTEQGETQENSRPPRALDMTVFRGYTIYANVTNYRALTLSLVSADLITNNDILTIGTRQYIFKSNAANGFVGNMLVTGTAARVANVVTVTFTNHGFATGDNILVVTSTLVPPIVTGSKTITVTGANTFTFADTAANSAGNIQFEGTEDSAGRGFVKVFKTNVTTTLSQSIANTASYLVKSINRDQLSTVYALYISGESDTPGQMFFESKDINATQYSVTISNAAASDAFLPSVPTSGTTLSDKQTASPGQILISKVNQPEAVPRINSAYVGSQSAAILRCAALRDSVIFYKADGVWRLNGDAITNFISTATDTTVICKARRSVAVLNNAVFAFSNQGIVQATDTAVQILSREDIEPVLSAILNNPSLLESMTAAVSYESERTYLLATLKPNVNVTSVTYCYNYLTNQYTTWERDEDFLGAGYVTRLDDRLIVASRIEPHRIYRERKENNKIDYSGEAYCVPVIPVTTGSVVVTLGSSVVTITSPYPLRSLVDSALVDLFPVGMLVTLTMASATIATVFAGGANDLNIQTNVVSVLDEYTFTINALSAATGNATGTLAFNNGLAEVNCSSTTVITSKTVTVTTPVPHGLTTGNPITVNWLSAAIAAAFTNVTDLTGYRPITVTGASTFTIEATNAAIASVTNTINISDRRQNRQVVTLLTPITIIPQTGDAIVTNNKIFKSLAVSQASSTLYNMQLQYDYIYNTHSFAFMNSAYTSNLKFAPITKGGVGKLKKHVECQISFRNDSSCTLLTVNFATDRTISTSNTDWNYRVGTAQTNIGFNGWGRPPWGNFPWGGGISTARDFYTRPAVSLRTYIPALAAYGTYLQPIIRHRVAGEPLELQNVAIESQVVTQRTTR